MQLQECNTVITRMQYRNYKNALTLLQECNNATTRMQYRYYKNALT